MHVIYVRSQHIYLQIMDACFLFVLVTEFYSCDAVLHVQTTNVDSMLMIKGSSRRSLDILVTVTIK